MSQILKQTTEKIDMKNQRTKRCKNALKCKWWDSYKRIYPYTYWDKIHQYFLQAITSAIQPLPEKLQRTVEFYTRNFMFFLRTSSERSQQSFFPLLCFHLHWKILSVPSLTKNTLICYNIILKAVL